MATLSIDFQDGFVNDTVMVQIDDEEVFRKERVSTRRLTGLAASFQTQVKEGSVRVQINVPTTEIARTILVEVSADTYLGISLVNGAIKYIVSAKPFGYA